MRLRELQSASEASVQPSWPPVWVSCYGRVDDSPRGEGGTLRSVRRITYAPGNIDFLQLVKTMADTEYVGVLDCDAWPKVARIETVLREHLGQSIRAIEELTL